MGLNRKNGTRLAGIAGATAVILGAFGAHGLEDRLTERLMDIYQTGVLYHLIHAVALFALALADEATWTSKWTPRVAWAWALGVVLFSGSLYVLAITDIGILGAITPFGGAAFIAGWVMLFRLRA